MSNKDYYARWLKIKEQMRVTLEDDKNLQELAINTIGIKPQANAVEVVARVYSKYCELYNKLCDCYDQMEQVQRRPCIKKIIDGVTCRIIELKKTLEQVEVFEFTYADNAYKQLLIQPQDVDILCPFFYPFEIRVAEMQYVMDQILAGNRLGDPPLTPSQLELQNEEKRLQEEKDAELKRNASGGSEEKIVFLTPAQMEQKRLLDLLNSHAFVIQRMERSRAVTKEKAHKAFKDQDLYLELAGLKKPQKSADLRKRASLLIQKIYKQFMQLKRDNLRETKIKEILGMVISSWKPVSAKVQLERVKEARRNFRRTYYEQWLQQNLKEKARVLKLKEGAIMDDITDEIRQWFTEWFEEVRVFDEFPFAEEGGSILIVKGETFSIEEYLQWRADEEKRLKAQGEGKSPDDIKAEKIAEREEKKRLAAEAKERQRRILIEYEKSRLNPDDDPGVYIMVGHHHDSLKLNWNNYEVQWNEYDTPDAPINVLKGHIMQIMTEDVYKDIHVQLRPIADEIMRLELEILKNALKNDYDSFEKKVPITKKRKKPKKKKPPKPDRLSPEVMFQRLADNGIVKKYPHVALDDYWGDRNYAAADCRAVLWTPTFPPPCIGDVKEQVRIRCLLSLGATCPGMGRTQLLVGPKGVGKKTLAYAIATETNSLLIDLSPRNVYNKFVGAKKTRIMYSYINKISRLMQPTVILVENAEKLFYKRVPQEEKDFDPTRLSKDFYKEIIKPLGMHDKILVIGTAAEPWVAKNAKLYKLFPSIIMIPKSDYGSISFILTHMLMKFHGVNRDFNLNSTAQSLRGYDISTIKSVVENLMNGKRLAELYHKPLQPMEILSGVLEAENVTFMDEVQCEMFKTWYMSYSPLGQKLVNYMLMLESQFILKSKQDKKKKPA